MKKTVASSQKLTVCTCLCIVIAGSAGCSGLGSRARHAAFVAARDPWTWGPLAGAAAISVTESDGRISKWAKTRTPVFGSQQAALEASDQFRLYSSNGAWLTFFAAKPQGQGSWLMEKGMDASGNMVGLAFARNTTGVLKPAVHRERPHGGPVHGSFPSAHATDAFAHATLGRHYVDDLRLDPRWRFGVSAALNTFAAATAWGRVEGGVHFPADVLGGAAVANFTTRFFMEMASPDGKTGWRVRPRTNEQGEVIFEIEKPF